MATGIRIILIFDGFDDFVEIWSILYVQPD